MNLPDRLVSQREFYFRPFVSPVTKSVAAMRDDLPTPSPGFWLPRFFGDPNPQLFVSIFQDSEFLRPLFVRVQVLKHLCRDAMHREHGDYRSVISVFQNSTFRLTTGVDAGVEMGFHYFSHKSNMVFI